MYTETKVGFRSFESLAPVAVAPLPPLLTRAVFSRQPRYLVDEFTIAAAPKAVEMEADYEKDAALGDEMTTNSDHLCVKDSDGETQS